MLDHAESLRQTVHSATDRAHKSAMGQFMTNARVASFMAGLFQARRGAMHLLDPGAGLGALTCAVLEHHPKKVKSASVEAWELDARLAAHLTTTLSAYEAKGARVAVHNADFLADVPLTPRFTHCCMNPPYKKIATDSAARINTRRFGLETVNLYSAFVGAALDLMLPGGQLVAIIPRSFANGPYYLPFRRFVLQRAAIHRIHLFDSRQKAFSDDDVLQENVILLLERGGTQGDVVVSTSTDDAFADVAEQTFPFASIVQPGDDQVFIHMPTDAVDPLASKGIDHSLTDLDVSVSTGPVVDFRMRDYTRAEPQEGAVPLLYAHHYQGTRVEWPAIGAKKPNAIVDTPETRKWLVPAGLYLSVRRFSAKEEKRRVVASLVDTTTIGPYAFVGIENHQNYFHRAKRGLPKDLAWGLFVYLNSTLLDDHLRRFSGHTQVNATDLRNIRYPSSAVLEEWGRWAQAQDTIEQTDIDTIVGELRA
ncbi:Eco57I restriction-modification methylase domain-containing protein [Pseudoxanthomonas winnipegensis]|uniref:Eco57I restriction-modification methylase domain-containing protein n=1 Tax=Pseudoxanthomonas winnipegensis TaxID=2480810 RepID=UPI00103E956E|nr:Eco57I restriction-modification methylase domain-containing protein [Pseudoxanthomonas winnipegensis]TBV69776.1 SAM-dependent methyltransferase [Pseudoxanthomonas winnipegensis]